MHLIVLEVSWKFWEKNFSKNFWSEAKLSFKWELFHAQLFDRQKVNGRRKALEMVFERTWSNFHTFLGKFSAKLLVWSPNSLWTVCSMYSCYVRTKYNLYAGHGVRLTLRRYFWTKKKGFCSSVTFCLFFHSKFLAKSYSEAVREVMSTGLANNVWKQHNASNFTANQQTYIHFITIYDLRGKKETWTFLAARFGKFVARLWPLILRVLILKQLQQSKVYGIKKSSVGWSKFQTFWCQLFYESFTPAIQGNWFNLLILLW